MMEEFRKTGYIKRSLEIARAGGAYFLFHKLNTNRNKGLGERMRLACEDLGLVFIKMGQVLSTRYDLLNRSDCKELQKLLDEVPPMQYASVREIFLKDFNALPEHMFARFDNVPIASASIAQVYKAVTISGDTVAVKVKRPGVERAISSDIKIFKMLGRLAALFSGDIRHINLPRILDQLEEWLLAEVDFLKEVANLEKANSYYDKRVNEPDAEYARLLVFPKPYKELSSKNVLVMTFIEGISLRQLSGGKIVRDPSYDVRLSLNALMRAVLRAWINKDELIFHEDPHPSNLVLLPGGKIGLFDFGLMGRFDSRDIEQTRALFLAVYSKNVESSTRLALEMCNAPESLDTPALREDVKKYIEGTQFSGVGFWFTGFIRIFVNHRIPMPYQLVLFGRCMAILEGVFEVYLPGTKALDILGEELERGMRKRLVRNLASINIVPALYVLSEKLKNAPGDLAAIVDKYFDDPLKAIKDIKEAIKA